MLFYSVWIDVHIQSHVFETVERGAQIKVPDVNAKKLGVFGGEDRIE